MGAMVRLRKKAHQIPLQKPAGPEDKDNMAGNEGLRVGGTGSWSVRTQWIFFAMASGACAAFNGVFAKLTTTDLTTTLSQSVANALGLANIENIVEYVVRGMFFGLNLLFNAIMVSLHHCPGEGHVDYPSIHHEHLGQLHHHRLDGLLHFQRVSAWAVVGWRCVLGCRQCNHREER